MRLLFKDERYQQLYDMNGYVKLDGKLIDTVAVNELTSFFLNSGINKPTDTPVFIAMDHPEKKLVGEMTNLISNLIMNELDKVLIDPYCFYSCFISKSHNSSQIVKPHQDGSFVENESENNSVNCWIPLVDVDIRNGCLGFIKGSNKILKNIRPLPSPYVYRPLDNHETSLIPYFELVPMKAGEVVIFDNKTIHSSPPNVTNTSRLAISLWITQKNTPLRGYYLKPGTSDTVLKYKIDAEFFKKYDNQILAKLYEQNKTIDDYELEEEIDYHPAPVSQEEMIRKVTEAGNVYNKEYAAYIRTHLEKKQSTSFTTSVRQLVFKIKNFFN